MSQYKLYRHEKGALKGSPERGIYANPEGWLYFRILLGNGKDTFKPCSTRSIQDAIKMRDARNTAKAMAGLGIAEAPDEAGKMAKVTVARIVYRYQTDGYPCPSPNGQRRCHHSTCRKDLSTRASCRGRVADILAAPEHQQPALAGARNSSTICYAC